MLPFEDIELSRGTTQETDFDSMETSPAEQPEVEHLEDVQVLQQSQAQDVEDVQVLQQVEQVEDVHAPQQLEDGEEEQQVSCVV